MFILMSAYISELRKDFIPLISWPSFPFDYDISLVCNVLRVFLSFSCYSNI